MNASLGASVVLAAITSVAIGDDPIQLAGVVLQAAAADPMTTIQLVLPIDVVELTKAVFTGIAAIGSAFAAIYAVVGAARAKRAEAASKENSTNLGKVVDDVKLIERNTNSLTSRLEAAALQEGTLAGIAKGLQTGAEAAAVLAKGQREGRDDERASVAAANQPLSDPAPSIIPAPSATLPSEVQGKSPVPVTDDRTAVAGERVAEATERMATATEEKK